jgi:hypothetical protein
LGDYPEGHQGVLRPDDFDSDYAWSDAEYFIEKLKEKGIEKEALKAAEWFEENKETHQVWT